MNLHTARDELAAEITADTSSPQVFGYARPPGQIGRLPAAVVLDPDLIRYHTAAGRRLEVTFPIRVIVTRGASADGAIQLDQLVSTLPDIIEAADGSWVELVVDELAGGYTDYIQGDQIIGIAADLTCRFIFTP